MGQSIRYNAIRRHEIPSLERRGGVAYRVIGEIDVIALHHGSVDIETPIGVPANVSESLKNCDPGIADAVVVGSVCDGIRVELLDVLMVDKKSVRVLPWQERMDLLKKVYDGFSDESKKMFQLAPKWTRGLMSAFDASSIGGGILIRVPGKADGYICIRQGEAL